MPAAITPTRATTMKGAPMAVAASMEYPVIVTSSPYAKLSMPRTP